MINLLPDDTKQQIRAGRANSSLIKIVILLGIAVTFLGLACGASYMFLINTKSDAQNVISRNQSKSNSYSSVVNQANAISLNFSKSKSIIEQQVSFSKIIMGIASAMPDGIVLDGLSISRDTIGTPITLKMRARTTNNVDVLKANFEKSLLFSNYSLQILKSNPSDTTGYPVDVSIGITINKSASL